LALDLQMNEPRKIVIIGGGAAGLLAADLLSATCEVNLYEQGKTVGRKFLVAGKGGFNLTNAATGAELAARYLPPGFLDAALRAFDTAATRAWLLAQGIPTFVGSSGRVFPEKGIKPAQVLQNIKDKLGRQGVRFHYQHEFIGFDEQQKPIVRHGNTDLSLQADRYLFALGGASWPVTGANSRWPAAFARLGLQTLPFQSSNCGVNVCWPAAFRKDYAGTPLKNILVTAGGRGQKGEALITEYGLEGNVIYPLGPTLRAALASGVPASLRIDFKPQNSGSQLLDKIRGKNIRPKNYSHEFNLTRAQLALIKAYTTWEQYLDPALFIGHLKELQVPIASLRPVEEAISTVGGIAVGEISADFSLKRFPHLVVMGEMIDWDAPTGGFLLQGCFSTAHFAARAILQTGLVPGV
jgi:uncharacterized flavoprotein (TIGR03862 family)